MVGIMETLTQGQIGEPIKVAELRKFATEAGSFDFRQDLGSGRVKPIRCVEFSRIVKWMESQGFDTCSDCEENIAAARTCSDAYRDEYTRLYCEKVGINRGS